MSEHSASQRSTFARLASTPMRDIVRGRITGRLDLDALLAASGLEKPLTDLIRRVAKRTRLTRLEKIDVARELIAHFQDGRAAGRTPEELIGAFGDVRDAARLIRRARKRNRPAPVRALGHAMKGVGVFVAALFVVYIVFAVRFFTADPNPDRNYVTELNAAMPEVPPGERAWPVYKEAFAALAPYPDAFEGGYIPHYEQVDQENETYAPLVRYIEENQRGVELLREAASKPAMGVELSTSPGDFAIDWPKKSESPVEVESSWPIDDLGPNALLNVVLFHQYTIRSAALLLASDATLAAQQDDVERALRDIDAIIGMGSHAGEAPFISSDLVKLSIYNVAMKTASRLLAAHGEAFADEQLVRLAHAFAALDDQRLWVAFQHERYYFYDMLQRLYGEGDDATITWGGLHMLTDIFPSHLHQTVDPAPSLLDRAAGPVAAAFIANRGDMRAKYDELMDLAEAEAGRALWERDGSALDRRIEDLRSGSIVKRARYYPIHLLMPAIDKIARNSHLTAQSRDGLLIAIALHLYERHADAFPKSLDALVPRHLPAVPRDRFDGKPMRYTLRDGEPIVYSIGTDYDDDGGAAPVNHEGEPIPGAAARWRPRSEVEQMQAHPDFAHSIPDGDWILYPPHADN